MKTKLAVPVPAVKLPMRRCEECDYQREDEVCRVGHTARRYVPRHAEGRQWGYQLRCADFRPARRTGGA